MEGHCFQGDATNQNACQNEKLHVATVRSAIVRDRGVAVDFGFVSNLADLQTVKAGTAAELYGMALREMDSVGCPTWPSRCADSMRAEASLANQTLAELATCTILPLLTMYIFGFDQGSENGKFTKMACSALSNSVYTMMTVVWCLSHQSHIIVRCLLEYLDAFDWSVFLDDDTDELEVWESLPHYTLLVSNFSSCWRSPGQALGHDRRSHPEQRAHGHLTTIPTFK
jgi:hypothetical protein